LLRQADSHGVELIYYVCALNLFEVIPLMAKAGVDLQSKVAGRCWTPILIAALFDSKEVIKALSNQGASHPPSQFDSHEEFTEMLNREFPEGLIIEQSSIGNLPRQCGISEGESKNS
jgi:hypothetical protein